MNTNFLTNMRIFDVKSCMRLLNSRLYVVKSWGFDQEETLFDSSGQVKGLLFSVDGNHFTGKIVLSVNFMDYYEVRFFQDDVLVDTFTDVFVGDVIDMIDKKVEYLESYIR